MGTMGTSWGRVIWAEEWELLKRFRMIRRSVGLEWRG